jgi:hypothetical protein
VQPDPLPLVRKDPLVRVVEEKGPPEDAVELAPIRHPHAVLPLVAHQVEAGEQQPLMAARERRGQLEELLAP